jgi:hypothetical protein
MNTSNHTNPANLDVNNAGFPPAPSTAHQRAAGDSTTGEYFAQPFRDAAGFYFSDYEEYTEKAARLTDRYGDRVEEVELQAVDLDDAKTELFNALNITQASLESWFSDVECLDQRDMAALFFLVTNNGYNLDDAMDKKDDVTLYEGCLLDAATDLFDECYLCDLPENSPLRTYVDYESFARDLSASGDAVEFSLGGTTYTCTSANNC